MIISLAGLSIYIAMRDISRQAEQDELFSRADQVCDEYDQNLRESVSGGKASSEKDGSEALTEAATELISEPSGEELFSEAADAMYEEMDEDSHLIIFVGDSRTVGMGTAMRDIPDPCLFIGLSGEGYNWFAEEGIKEMRKAVREHPHSPVVFNLGVNDMSLIEDYLDLYKKLPKEFPETAFYFMSVNPVTAESAHVTNDEIRAFNRKIKAAFPSQYIDCYRFMKVTGFESVDGVHYSEDTYRDIHDFVVKAIFSPLRGSWWITGALPLSEDETMAETDDET